MHYRRTVQGHLPISYLIAWFEVFVDFPAPDTKSLVFWDTALHISSSPVYVFVGSSKFL